MISGVRRWAGFPDQVAIQLEVLPQPAPLLALVPEQLGNREPANRLAEPVGPLGDHAREGRSHLGAERHLAPALVGEVIELGHDLRPALLGVEIEGLERGAVVFLETVAAGHPAHGLEDVGPEGKLFREKVPESGQGLVLHRHKIIGLSPDR